MRDRSDDPCENERYSSLGYFYRFISMMLIMNTDIAFALNADKQI